MTPSVSSDLVRVLVISNEDLFIKEASTILESDKNILVEEAVNLEDGVLQIVKISQPDILLYDYRFRPLEETIDLLDDISILHPDTATIVIIPDADLLNASKVILAGARTFLSYPFTRDNLLSTLKRVSELQSRLIPSSKTGTPNDDYKSENSFLVFSPKGGVGCTTVAINLAIALYQEIDEEILLVDGKHLFGDIGLMLNIKTANSIIDLIPHIGHLDEALVRQVVIKHTSGLQVLPSPFSASVSQPIRPDDLYKIITGLRTIYPTMVVDGGSYLNDDVVTMMDSSERVILVITPDLSALRNARLFLDICRSLSYPREKILLIMNKVSGRNDVSMNEVEKVLRTKIFGIIPADENISLSALNEGIPIILKRSNHSISKAYKKIAKNLIELTNLSPFTRISEEPVSEVLNKSSRLG